MFEKFLSISIRYTLFFLNDDMLLYPFHPSGKPGKLMYGLIKDLR